MQHKFTLFVKIVISIIITYSANAQTNTEQEFAKFNIEGSSPSKLVSIAYDYAMPSNMESTFFTNNYPISIQESTFKVQSYSGFRANISAPVIKSQSLLLAVRMFYNETFLNAKNEYAGMYNPVFSSLNCHSLKSTGLGFTVFKPFNKKYFILLNTVHESNGNFSFSEWQPFYHIKHSIAGVFGWNAHERRQIGFGISRTYRGGVQNYTPVLLYNYTFPNKKMGFELALPARGQFRYKQNGKTWLYAGYELEGSSYRILNRNNDFTTNSIPYTDIELKRSELRPRIMADYNVFKFLWLTAQVGYRINVNYDWEQGDKFALKKEDRNILTENKLSNALYFQLGAFIGISNQ